jgi:membrane-associated phospholipid phosphatase
MHKTQQIISALLHPLTLPLFGTILLLNIGIFGDLPLAYRLYVEGIVLLNMGIIPSVGIWLLMKGGHVSDMDVSKRSERVLPYLIVWIAGISACILLYRARLPWWIVKLFIGSSIATFLAFFITLKWKISAHTMAFGCIIGSAFLICFKTALNPQLILSVMFLLAGLQASSRIYLKAHSLSQVGCGFLLGVFSVSATFFLIP